MTAKFSQFNAGGAQIAGDQIVGLRAGVNTIFNAVPVSNIPWISIGVAATLIPNTGYYFTNIGSVTYNMPAVFPFGEIIYLVNTAGNITIRFAPGQVGFIGPSFSSAGGTLSTNAVGSSILLGCFSNNTDFIALTAPQGVWSLA